MESPKVSKQNFHQNTLIKPRSNTERENQNKTLPWSWLHGEPKFSPSDPASCLLPKAQLSVSNESNQSHVVTYSKQLSSSVVRFIADQTWRKWLILAFLPAFLSYTGRETMFCCATLPAISYITSVQFWIMWLAGNTRKLVKNGTG